MRFEGGMKIVMYEDCNKGNVYNKGISNVKKSGRREKEDRWGDGVGGMCK